MKKYVNLATFYVILGLIGGVFFREFTKLSGFEGTTVLRGIHTHTLVLGFIFFLVVMLLDKTFAISKAKAYTAWLITYNVGLLYMVTTLLVRGITEVRGTQMAGLNHIAGLGHAVLGVAMIWFVLILYRTVGKEA